MDKKRVGITIGLLVFLLVGATVFFITQDNGVQADVPDEVPHGQEFTMSSQYNATWSIDGQVTKQGAKVTHSFDSPETYDVKVGHDGATTTYTVRAVNKDPIAEITASETVGSGSSTQMRALQSTDPNGDSLGFEWDVNNDGQFEKQGATVDHTFSSTGNHTVTLRVSDAYDGSATSSTTITVSDPCQGVYYDGTGTKQNPYRISSADEFNCASELFWNQFPNKPKQSLIHVEVTNDINLSNTPYFTNIVPDNVVLNGNNHTVSNVNEPLFRERYVERSEETTVVRNLRVENADVQRYNSDINTDTVGIVYSIVRSEDLLVVNTHVNGTIRETPYNTGGIIGEADNGIQSTVEIRDSSFTGTIDASRDEDKSARAFEAGNEIGGLIGETSNLTVVNSTVYATITGDNNVGGVVGRADSHLRAIDVTADVDVTSKGRSGGLVGELESSSYLNGVHIDGSLQGFNDSSEFHRSGGIAGRVLDCNSEFQEYSDEWYNVSFIGSAQDGGLSANSRCIKLRDTVVVAEDVDDAMFPSFRDDIDAQRVYYNNERSSSEVSGATGLTTSQMTGDSAQENMEIDFETVWSVTDEYPVLR